MKTNWIAVQPLLNIHTMIMARPIALGLLQVFSHIIPQNMIFTEDYQCIVNSVYLES